MGRPPAPDVEQAATGLMVVLVYLTVAFVVAWFSVVAALGFVLLSALAALVTALTARPLPTVAQVLRYVIKGEVLETTRKPLATRLLPLDIRGLVYCEDHEVPCWHHPNHHTPWPEEAPDMTTTDEHQTDPVESKEDRIRSIVECLPDGYDLYAAVGALCSIASVLDQEDEPPVRRARPGDDDYHTAEDCQGCVWHPTPRL